MKILSLIGSVRALYINFPVQVVMLVTSVKQADTSLRASESTYRRTDLRTSLKTPFKHLQSSESCRISCSADCFTVLDSATTKFQVKLKESMYIKWKKPDLYQQVKHQFDAFLVGTSTFGRLRSGARALYFTVETFKLYASWCYVRILVIAILCNQTLVILTVTLTMTDVPSKHVWKIKESRIVFKDFDIIAVVSTFWINFTFPFTRFCIRNYIILLYYINP